MTSPARWLIVFAIVTAPWVLLGLVVWRVTT